MSPTLLEPKKNPNRPLQRSPIRLALGAAILLVLLLLRAGGYLDDGTLASLLGTQPQATVAATASPRAPAVAVSTAAPTAKPSQAAPTPAPDEGLPTVGSAQLPPEAQHVMDLIARGGPFPYRQDGTVFQNRERLLPQRPNGYYHEYTVETPGSPDRGAQRIIAGEEGDLYYTADHYASFQRIVP